MYKYFAREIGWALTVLIVMAIATILMLAVGGSVSEGQVKPLPWMVVESCGL